MRKILYHTGETLVETMFSLAMISVTFIFLAGAVVAAVRVNDKIRNSGSEFQIQPNPQPVNQDTVTITITDSDNPDVGETITKTVDIYQSEENEEGNKYYYYRVVKESGEAGG